MAFINRLEAGRNLANKLGEYKGRCLVLAIPRGGVEVGYALAQQLNCPLDIIISKKIPYPGQPELAIGAVCNDMVSLDNSLISVHDISRSYVEDEINKLKATIKNRYTKLTGKTHFPDIRDKVVIVTDDGLATGHTFFAAVEFVKSQKPKKIIAAVPVGPPDNLEILKKKVDELVVLEVPEYFMAVGEFYGEFTQLTDEDVLSYLKKANF